MRFELGCRIGTVSYTLLAVSVRIGGGIGKALNTNVALADLVVWWSRYIFVQ